MIHPSLIVPIRSARVPLYSFSAVTCDGDHVPMEEDIGGVGIDVESPAADVVAIL